MIALYIIIGLILLVLIALYIRVGLSLSYSKKVGEDEKYFLYAEIGPVKFKLLPKKKQKIKLSDFSAENYRKMVELASESKESDTSKTVTAKNQKEKLLPEGLGEAFNLLKYLLNKFSDHIICKVIQIKLFVGTNDSALTAFAYTGVVAAVSFILEFINNNAELRLRSPKNVLVTADFESGEFHGDVSIKLSIRILDIIRAELSLLKNT